MKSTTKGSRYRRSQQRDRILELLKETHTHPTANWLYDRMREDFPNVSMGTVYRNLTVLADQGLVNRIGFDGTLDRFDANTAPHYHFVCDACGSIVDLDLPVDEALNRRVREVSGLIARSHDIQFRGRCASCGGKRTRGVRFR